MKCSIRKSPDLVAFPYLFLLPKRAERRIVPYISRGREIMYLIFYVKDGVKGWKLADSELELEVWAEENLDTSEMSGEDEYEIVDLARRDLQKELSECREKLAAIRKILK